jgi:hypothetical protein
MYRTEDQLAHRRATAHELREAFERAQAAVEEQHFPASSFSSVIAYINYLMRWQRRVLVTINDDGNCDVFISKTYEVPEGKSGRDVDLGQMHRIFSLPSATPDLGRTLVSRVRGHAIEDSETIPTKLFPPKEPPIPIAQLATLADLIDAHEAYFPCKPYNDLLASVLSKTGRVMHKGAVWELEGTFVCHSTTAPGSPQLRGSDGEPVVYTNAAHIRLEPFLSRDQVP